MYILFTAIMYMCVVMYTVLVMYVDHCVYLQCELYAPVVMCGCIDIGMWLYTHGTRVTHHRFKRNNNVPSDLT